MSEDDELEAGRVDVLVIDEAYARGRLGNANGLRKVAPNGSQRPVLHAFHVAPGDEAWVRRLDAFVASIQRDGRLLAAATRHNMTDMVILR